MNALLRIFGLAGKDKGYENVSAQHFSGRGPFTVGQRQFADKEDYRRGVEQYLRARGVTEYQVTPSQKMCEDGTRMTGYEFRFKNVRDMEDLEVLYIGDKKPNTRGSTVTERFTQEISLSENAPCSVYAYRAACEKFMNHFGISFASLEVDHDQRKITVVLPNRIDGYFLARAEREGHIKDFLHDGFYLPFSRSSLERQMGFHHH